MSALIVKGQNEYFFTDSNATYGVKLVDGGDLMNSKFCQVKTEGKVVRYTPYEVKEYGLKNGRVYVAREINIADSSKMVFLQRLYNGKTTLYYYRGKRINTYFIEKDSTVFVEIPKEDNKEKQYTEMLLNYTADCPNVSSACKLVSYSKKSITKLISRYNDCELESFPFFKYGLFIGMVQSELVRNSNIKNADLLNTSFKKDNNPYAGIFVDAPINASNFSFFTSLGLYQSSFSSNKPSDSHDASILINQTTIKVPLMIRYTVPSLNFRPYFNIGLNYSYNLRNESVIYTAEINNNIVQYQSPVREDVIHDHQPGYACGMGIQYHLDYKRMLFVEARFNKEYSMKSAEMFNKNTFEIISGISF